MSNFYDTNQPISQFDWGCFVKYYETIYEDTNMNKIYMTWENFDSDIKEFIDFITLNDFMKDSVILALKRGGFASAIALSNKTGIPVSTVTYQTRDGNDSVPNFLEPDLIKNAKKIIIPDDIYDTGLTVENTVAELVNKFEVPIENIAGLFHYVSDNLTKTELKLVKYMRHNDGRWVRFPWE